jgi:hypothetical protein
MEKSIKLNFTLLRVRVQPWGIIPIVDDDFLKGGFHFHSRPRFGLFKETLKAMLCCLEKHGNQLNWL